MKVSVHWYEYDNIGLKKKPMAVSACAKGARLHSKPVWTPPTLRESEGWVALQLRNESDFCFRLFIHFISFHFLDFSEKITYHRCQAWQAGAVHHNMQVTRLEVGGKLLTKQCYSSKPFRWYRGGDEGFVFAKPPFLFAEPPLATDSESRELFGLTQILPKLWLSLAA